MSLSSFSVRPQSWADSWSISASISLGRSALGVAAAKCAASDALQRAVGGGHLVS